MSIHVTEAEAARDFAGLLAKVRLGEHIVIGAETAPVAVLRPATWPEAWPEPRTLKECLAAAIRHEKETGYAPYPDADFARDVEEGIKQNSEPWQPPAWD